jgi:hypothetical protein
MTPETLRIRYKAYLAKNLRINDWGLNFPANVEDVNQPPSIAREDPVTDNIAIVELADGVGDISWVQMRLAYKVMYRFDRSKSYTDLPKAQAETLMLRMLQHLQANPECLDEDIREIKATGKITIAEVENNDWLLVYDFAFASVFLAEAAELIVRSTLMRSVDVVSGPIPSEMTGTISEPIRAAQTIEAGRMVAVEDYQLVYADSSNLNHAYSVLGLLTASVIQGQTTNQVHTHGPITLPEWNWLPNQPVFLGVNGVLTQTPPLTGFLQEVAQVITPQLLDFSLQEVSIYD